VSLALVGLSSGVGWAEEDEPSTGERVLGGVLSGLLGQPGQPADAAYLAKERERLVSLLQSGQYATSRQGEPVDLMVLGIPLTRADRVYTARPIQPSSTAAQSGFPR
jgi:hypothetical protein